MTLVFLIRGLLIGFIASIPLGPVGVLCIQRTLSKNQKSGFISGLGASAADTIFSGVALFSLSFILSFIEDHMTVIKVIGGLVVIIIGVGIFMKNPVVQIRRNRAGKTNLWQDFISVFFVTLANVAFIFIFIFLFATFGVSESTMKDFNGWLMLLGVLLGSATWWFLLTFLVSLFRSRFRPRHMLWINRISGSLIMLLGAGTIISMFLKTPIIDGFVP